MSTGTNTGISLKEFGEYVDSINNFIADGVTLLGNRGQRTIFANVPARLVRCRHVV
jgi:hypothetical protein